MKVKFIGKERYGGYSKLVALNGQIEEVYECSDSYSEQEREAIAEDFEERCALLYNPEYIIVENYDE